MLHICRLRLHLFWARSAPPSHGRLKAPGKRRFGKASGAAARAARARSSAGGGPGGGRREARAGPSGGPPPSLARQTTCPSLVAQCSSSNTPLPLGRAGSPQRPQRPLRARVPGQRRRRKGRDHPRRRGGRGVPEVGVRQRPRRGGAAGRRAAAAGGRGRGSSGEFEMSGASRQSGEQGRGSTSGPGRCAQPPLPANPAKATQPPQPIEAGRAPRNGSVRSKPPPPRA